VYQKTVLPNGLRILTSNMPHVRSVSVNVFIGAGSRYESGEKSGISHFVEHLLFKGTQQRPTSNTIAETIEGIGGVLNGGTDKELTVYWIKAMNSHLELALDVLADMVLNSKFDPVEAEKERQVIIEEINMSMDSPQQRVNLLIDEIVWPDQPLGRDVAGSKETVLACTHQMLIDYWKCQYGPSNTVVSVAGDVHHDEVVTIANRLFGDWTDGNPTTWFPAQNNQDIPRIIADHRDTEQSHICLALRGPSSEHPDRFIFDIINVILGEGMSCRLFREIRENKGLAYDIHSYVSHFFDSGALTVYAGVGPNNVEATIGAVLNELSQLKHTTIPELELSKAKEMVKGRLVLRMEDSRSVSGWIASQELLIQKIRSVEEVVSIVEAITTDDLVRVANDLFHSKGLSLAIAGPNINESRLNDLLAL
jgi:predicted Zn-dependent peptidase